MSLYQIYGYDNNNDDGPAILLYLIAVIVIVIVTVSMFIATARQFILDLLFPKCCLGCGQEETLLCGRCEEGLRMIPPACFACKKLVPETLRLQPGRTCKDCREHTAIHTFLSPFSYQDQTIRELVHNLKYYRLKDIARELGRMLDRYLKYFEVVLPESCIIVPIPLHPKRKRVRGFNQAERIAAGFIVSASLPMEIDSELLLRAIKTRPQVELSGEERRKNILGAFALKNDASAQGKIILLVDDVKTTGATLEEAARVLKEAGAKEVWAMTVAH